MKSRKIRQTEAQQRDAARAKRSDQEQLKLLDSRPGNSARERARLEGRIAAAAAKTAPKPAPVTTPEPAPKAKKPRTKRKAS
jgi:hypothetical protein